MRILGRSRGPARRPRRARMKIVAPVVAVLAAVGLATPVVASTATGTPEDSGAKAEQNQSERLPLVELTHASGVGRLYTLNPDEARRAEQQHGMRRTPVRVASLPADEFEDSIAIHRLKPSKDATRWLLSTEPAEWQRLVDDGWVDEGVIGYLSTRPGGEKQHLLRFTNGKEWVVRLESRRDEMADAGYQVDGTLGYAWR